MTAFSLQVYIFECYTCGFVSSSYWHSKEEADKAAENHDKNVHGKKAKK